MRGSHRFLLILIQRRSLKIGTTTSSYFSSIYGNTTSILANKAQLYGQRAFIGKVNFNVPEKRGYTETTESSINDTKALIQYIKSLKV